MIIKNQILKIFIGCLFVVISPFILSGCATMQNWFSFLSVSDNLQIADKIDKQDLKKFMSSVRAVKGNAQNQYRLARHFQKQNRHEIAIEELLKTLRIDPEFYNAYNALGVSYDHLKQHDSAIDAYRAALKINSDLDYVHNNIGYSNLLKGDLSAATVAFEKAIAINGTNKTYQNNLALAYAKSGQKIKKSKIAESYKPKTKVVHPILDTENITSETLTEIINKVAEENIEAVTVASKQTGVKVSKIEENFYAIQLGVYYDVNRALNTLEQARKKGYASPYITKINKAKPYYRVRFGKYKNRSDAQIIAAKILDKKGRSALTIVENYPVEVFHVQSAKQSTDDKIVKVQKKALNKSVNIEILNGNGIYRMARRVSNYFEKKGLVVATPANAKHFNYKNTRIYYAPGFYRDAVNLSQNIPGFKIAGKLIESTKLKTNIRVLIGKDIIPFNEKLKRNFKI